MEDSAEATAVASVEEAAAGRPTRYLGRQPILDQALKLYGYELLVRAAEEGADQPDPEAAAHEVMSNYMLMISPTSRERGFIRCTRKTLVTGIVTLLPPLSTVLELDEEMEPDAALLSSCRSLRKKGYHFALTNCRPREVRSPWLEFAEFVKVDFVRWEAAERQWIYRMAKPAGVKLLAERVETVEAVDQARAEGCKFFQGYFFSRPIVVPHRAVPSSHLVYLRILAALTKASPSTQEIERIILSDPSLCYRLLRLVNSALYGLPTRITSIRTALVLVGDDGIRKLVTIALAAVYADREPRALAMMALERARFCELLAPEIEHEPAEMYLLGMLSLIDVIMQAPMQEILDALPLSGELKAALSGGGNRLGSVLGFLRCYESGDWLGCEGSRRELGLSEKRAAALYVDSVRWASVAVHA